MAKYQKAPPPPPPPPWKRFLAWAHTPLGATIVGGLVVAAVVFYVFEHGGDNSPIAPPTATRAKYKAGPPKKPANATEQAAQRQFWISPPRTFDGADEAGGSVAATTIVPVDLLVGRPKEIYEEPEDFEGLPFYAVGRVTRQESVEDPFYDREFQLTSGEGGYDMYVGADDYLAFAPTGDVAVVFGRLAAIGETRRPGSSPKRSVYLLSSEEDEGKVDDALLFSTSSGTLRRAIKRVSAETQK
jgi:hypothetical protein